MAKSIAIKPEQAPEVSPLEKQKEKLKQALDYRNVHAAEVKRLEEEFGKKQNELNEIQTKHGEETLNVDRANQVINTLAGILQDFGVDLSKPLFPELVAEAEPELVAEAEPELEVEVVNETPDEGFEV